MYTFILLQVVKISIQILLSTSFVQWYIQELTTEKLYLVVYCMYKYKYDVRTCKD